MLQRLPFQILHHHERSAVVLVDIVNGADAGMVERRSGVCLALEALQRLVTLSETLREEL
jgi:hypothetical protein